MFYSCFSPRFFFVFFFLLLFTKPRISWVSFEIQEREKIKKEKHIPSGRNPSKCRHSHTTDQFGMGSIKKIPAIIIKMLAWIVFIHSTTKEAKEDEGKKIKDTHLIGAMAS